MRTPETRTTPANPKSFLSSAEKNTPKKRAEQTAVGRVVNGWEIVDKVQKSEVGKIPHPIYRGICPVCGKKKDQTLAYFRNTKSCGCARYKVRVQEPIPEPEQTIQEPEIEKPERKQGTRKPGILLKYADMPETQQIMLSECLGSTWNAVQSIAGDQFLMLLDAFQGDNVQMPSAKQVEKRIIMTKIVSEFTRLKKERGYSDRYIDPILDEMAKNHKTSPQVIREILRLASIELRNARSEYAFSMYGDA